MSSPWASTQASASWLGVHPLAAASSSTSPRAPGSSGSCRPGTAANFAGSRRPAGPSSGLELAGQESAAERAVGDEPDAELAHGRQDLVLRVAAPERVFRLERGDRVHGRRPADRRRRRLRKPEVAHLSRLHQLGHRADGLLDRDASGRPGAGSRGRSRRPSAASGSRRSTPCTYAGSPRTPRNSPLGPADVAKLCGQDDLVAPARDRPADEHLVAAGRRTCPPCRGSCRPASR